MAKMDERLEKMVERYREINDLMMQSDVVSDRKTMAKLGREQNELTPIVETYEEYKKAVEELEEAKVLSKEEDKEIREMAQMELEELEPKIQNYLDRLELLLVPKDCHKYNCRFRKLKIDKTQKNTPAETGVLKLFGYGFGK